MVRRCQMWVPKEIIFVDKQTDQPGLRLPLEGDTSVRQNGFGPSWTSTAASIIPLVAHDAC